MHTSIQVAIGVAAGIGTAHRFGSVHWAVWLSLLLMYVLSLHAHTFRAALLAALLGASLFSLQMRLHSGVIDSHQSVLDDRVEELVTGKITGLPERMPGRVRVLLVTSDARIWLTLFFEGARAQLHLMPGQWIRVSARLKSPRGLRGLGTMNKGEQALAHGADLLASAPLASVEVFDESFSGWTLPVVLHDWAAREIASSSGSADGKHLVAAIAIGERGGMPPTLSNALRSSGIAHLIAVSGMHLAAVAGLVYFLVLVLWAWLPWRQYLEPASVAAGAALCAALLFTGVTGARASTCRALLVATFMLAGIMLDRRIRMMHAIAWAAFLLLVLNPILLWEPGFQMSFAATGVLALAFQKTPQLLPAEPLSRLGKIRGHAVDLFRASFWASLATAPIALYHFGQVAPVALLTNLIAVPFATLLLLPLSLVALIVIPLSDSLGQWLLLQATKCADVVVWASRAIDSVLPAVSRPPMNALELLLWLSFVLVLLRGRREGSRGSNSRTIVLAIALAMLFGVSRAYWGEYQARESESLRVTFVDIGQGDAAVIELPGGAVWLVDGGGLPFVAAASSEERQY
ncbi:MAG: ComEC/Rec2 family competence protein, partial [Kofleriaceae bacterium]|nr:ComEC/Rec2 family competence protein [Kofleriaceae bacterium]